MLVRLRRRHPRHAGHAARGQGRHHAGGTHRAGVQRAHARLRRLPRRLRQLPFDALGRDALLRQRHLRQAEGGRPDRGARHRAVLRPGQADVPARPLHQGRMPEVRRQGPVRRFLRGLRRRLRPDRPEEPVLRRLRRGAGAQILRPLFLQALRPALRSLPAPVHRADNGVAAERSRQQDAGMAGRGRREQAHRLGHLARRALLRLRDSGRAGQVFLRLARCADRLLRQPQAPRRAPAGDRRVGLHPPRRRHRAVPLHRQGHPLLPRAVLAGRAGARRLPHADQGSSRTAS